MELLTWSNKKQVNQKFWASSFKLRYFAKTGLLRTVYFAIFDLTLRYSIQVWGKHRNQTIKEIEEIQENVITIMSFKPKKWTYQSSIPNLKIMKLIDVPAYNNCVFVHDQLNENLPESFSNFFKTAPKQHKNNTRGSRNNTIIKPITNSVEPLQIRIQW